MLDIESRISASVEVFYGVRGKSETDLPIYMAARKIVDAGLGVEVLFSDKWDDCSIISEETIEQLTDICHKAKIITTHACINTWSPEALKKEILIAKHIGIPKMIIHPYVLGLGLDNFMPQPQEARDIFQYAKDNGVRLILENLGKTGIEATRQGLDMIGDGLGVCIDVGHAHRSCADDGVRPEDFINEFASAIIELHIDDNFGKVDLHLPPGKGNIDWQPVMDSIRKLRDDTILCLEVASPDNPLQTLAESRQFIIQYS